MTLYKSIPWMRETEIFTSGSEGYHTFRIPALAVAPDGTILAFCEGRRDGRDDWYAEYLLMKRSEDNGATWGSLQLLHGNGESTFHNPTVVVDGQTGTVWLSFNKELDRTYIMSSQDNGATWSAPVDITADVKLPNWHAYTLGPGRGVQLRNGRLVIPASHFEGTRMDWVFSHSHVIFSDDHGRHWNLGGSLGAGSDECELVETHDGSLYMTVRSADDRATRRLCSWSEDAGATWPELIELDDLPDPICQGSIVRFTDQDSHDRNRVILANLNSATRENLTLRVSYDECKSWATSKVLYPGPAGYSNVTVAPDMSICCLYERGIFSPYESIRLAQFNIEWLTDGRDGFEA